MAERAIMEPITATVAQFCTISGLSRDSVYRLIRDGEIRSVVICGRRLIELASYRDLLVRTSPHTSARRGGIGGGK
jgi:excisionase family DNA binding protein